MSYDLVDNMQNSGIIFTCDYSNIVEGSSISEE